MGPGAASVVVAALRIGRVVDIPVDRTVDQLNPVGGNRARPDDDAPLKVWCDHPVMGATIALGPASWSKGSSKKDHFTQHPPRICIILRMKLMERRQNQQDQDSKSYVSERYRIFHF